MRHFFNSFFYVVFQQFFHNTSPQMMQFFSSFFHYIFLNDALLRHTYPNDCVFSLHLPKWCRFFVTPPQMTPFFRYTSLFFRYTSSFFLCVVSYGVNDLHFATPPQMIAFSRCTSPNDSVFSLHLPKWLSFFSLHLPKWLRVLPTPPQMIACFSLHLAWCRMVEMTEKAPHLLKLCSFA